MNRMDTTLTKARKCFFLILFCFFESCISIKPAANNYGPAFYESFFLEKGVEKTYIKPLIFNSKENSLFIDFTLQNDMDTCVANFSIIGPIKLDKPDSVFISNGQTSVKLFKVEKLYAESIKTKHKIRYTSKLQVADFFSLLENSVWNIGYYKDSVAEWFELKKRGIQKLKKMKPGIYDCFKSDIPR